MSLARRPFTLANVSGELPKTSIVDGVLCAERFILDLQQNLLGTIVIHGNAELL
jgi:hypothetical protein